MEKKMKYRMKMIGKGWQIQSRVWWVFWMNVGPLHRDYNTAVTALRMANNIFKP